MRLLCIAKAFLYRFTQFLARIHNDTDVATGVQSDFRPLRKISGLWTGAAMGKITARLGERGEPMTDWGRERGSATTFAVFARQFSFRVIFPTAEHVDRRKDKNA